MRNVLREWRAELKKTFTGTRDAVPDWVRRLEEGDDAGYHLPGSAVWAVHGSMTTIVAGIRALLMQALHPGALAGVYDHSRFREDPLGRLAGTIRWIFTVSYGSTAAAREASEWVRRLHESVRGNYVDGHGVARGYSANDPELLRGCTSRSRTHSSQRTKSGAGPSPAARTPMCASGRRRAG